MKTTDPLLREIKEVRKNGEGLPFTKYMLNAY